jgi:hypothetical protein
MNLPRENKAKITNAWKRFFFPLKEKTGIRKGRHVAPHAMPVDRPRIKPSEIY